MQFIVKKQDILPALDRCSKIAKKNNNRPILQNVLINTDKYLELVTTNLEIILNRKVSAKVISSGKIVVNAEILYKIIKEMSEEITFNLRENVLEIFSGNTQFELVTIDPGLFPRIDFDSYETTEFCDGDILWEMIEKTMYAVSNEREELSGVFWQKLDNKLRMIATDGMRLSLVEKDINILIYWIQI
jgi:DNA polymerase-3 subunit beta